MLTGDADIDNKQIASLAIDLYNEYIVSKNTKIPGFGDVYKRQDQTLLRLFRELKK